ncbi:M16 family metallopeptidase [Tepidimonas charontis]|uniref:Putative zinc protease n=1 Tax=Tepidimonas charontis TaxID=2267262 RepID=A0A554XFT7_9BURK|nr:pitrilysin family protein [Tepidimonas charontis]TSE34639.1 putative zinc protease [Tepidimonas charontis]
MNHARVGLGRWRAVSALALLWVAGVVHAALPIEHWVQASGARIYWVYSPALPMVDVRIEVDGGSRRDPPQQAGLAAAVALMLDKGVAASPAGSALDENAVTEAWAELGAQWSATATLDRLSVALRSLTTPEILDGAVALAARQLAEPAFDAAVWARERERLIAAWQQAQLQPDTRAARAFAQAIYRGHPYGAQADPKTWAAITPEAMRAFYRRHAQACDARVTVVGRIERAQVDALVRRLLAGWEAHGCAPLPALPEVAPLAHAHTEQLPFAGAAQAQILVGQPGIARHDPDYLALQLANHIVGGGGFTSRLMRELRERRGLTYGVYSYFLAGRHAGAYTVTVQTRPDQAAQAVALVHEVLRDFTERGPTEAELAEAKAALIQSHALRLDSNRKITDQVAAIAWSNLPLDELDTWPARVAALDRDTVWRAWRRVIDPQRLVTVVVGAAP